MDLTCQFRQPASASGKLPFTLYKQIDDLSPFDDYRMKGRTYRYMDVEPEFPFGFGLSSSSLELGELLLSSSTLDGEPLTAKIKGANTRELFSSAERNPRPTEIVTQAEEHMGIDTNQSDFILHLHTPTRISPDLLSHETRASYPPPPPRHKTPASKKSMSSPRRWNRDEVSRLTRKCNREKRNPGL